MTTEASKGDPFWIVRGGEEAGCAHAMGLVEAGSCHHGGEAQAIDGIWPTTLTPNDTGGTEQADTLEPGNTRIKNTSEIYSRDGIEILRETIASSASLFQDHKSIVRSGQALVSACEARIAMLVSGGGGRCLQCAEPLLPLWRPSVSCAKCRLSFCKACAERRSREDIRMPGGKGEAVHLCSYCVTVLDWQEAQHGVGDGHAVWFKNGRLPIVEDVDVAMQEVSQIQKAHLLKQLLA